MHFRILKAKAQGRRGTDQRAAVSLPCREYKIAYLLTDASLSNSLLSLMCLLNCHPVTCTGRQPLERKATEVCASYTDSNHPSFYTSPLYLCRKAALNLASRENTAAQTDNIYLHCC